MAKTSVDPETGVLSVSRDAIKAWPEAESDCKGLYPVLDGLEYDLPGVEKDPRIGLPANPIILDLGANAGAFSVWATHRFPGCSIFAYEPNPAVYKLLEENVGENVRVNRCAVGAADGKALLYVGLHNVGECSLVNRGEQDMSRAGHVKLVHARHLPEADILKIDTEGSERTILEHYPHLDGVKVVMLEYHSHDDRVWLRQALMERGFTLVLDKERTIGFGVQKWVRLQPPKLFIAVLTGAGQVFADHEACMDMLRTVAPQQGISLVLPKNGGTGVDRARNRCVAEALKDPTVTHFMFVDADIVFDPQWVVNMLTSGLDAVAAPYPRKSIDWKMVEAAVKNGVGADELEEHSTSWIINYAVDEEGHIKCLTIPNNGDYMEVEEVGTGFLMVRRAVLEKMLEAYGHEMAYVTDYEPRGEVHNTMFACQIDPACRRERAKRALLDCAREWRGPSKYETKPGGGIGSSFSCDELVRRACEYAEASRDPSAMGRYLTEDYAFCRLWRMLGGKLYLYLDAPLKHIGINTFCGNARHFFKRLPDAADTQQTEISGSSS